MKSVDDGTKMKVIRLVDRIKADFVGTTYARDLRAIRNKYIYKDISFSELEVDLNKIKDINNIKKNKT
jgi:hypothetical protein